jgi:hypothetical protein
MRKAQALLWNDNLKVYVTSYIKFADQNELEERLAETQNAHYSFVQWPLVVNGQEMWEDE